MTQRRAATVLTTTAVLVLGLCQASFAYLHPQAGRFLQRDPLGYQDGNQLYLYVGAKPATHTDPDGRLTVRPLGQNLNNVKCGENAWTRWDFELAAPAPCDGFIVQKVEVRCTVKDCTDCPNHSPVGPDFVYWEAWFVERNAKTHGEGRRRGFTDEAFKTINKNACGNYSQVGEVRFFCSDPAAGGTGPLPGHGWRRSVTYGQGRCRTQTGPILSTDKEPPWWQNGRTVEGPAHRSFSAYWNCCPNCFVHAHASPS